MAFEDLIWLFSQGETTRNIIRINIAEGVLLYKTAKKVCQTSNHRTCATLVEIGRKYGGSTALLASVMTPYDNLYSIDIVMHEQVNANLATAGVSHLVNLVTGDSKYVGKKWTRPIDLIFIDGDHSYRGVKSDIEVWLHHVKPFGYALFHDVIGKKEELTPLMSKLQEEDWRKTDEADTTLCLQRIPKLRR